ncbi:MAG: signal recognition particle protein, partial [Clostridia bacterium]|nr:signal recognition particle protein [Clostridia bacterium]
MAVFDGLSEKLNHIFSKLKNKGKLTELEIRQAMREIRIALLEADVNISVAKKFINDVSEKAVGQEILKSLTPAQQVIKIINEELTALMGSKNSKLEFANKGTTVYMLCGLQGAGKTTLSGKLALYLKNQKKKVLLVAADVYRPAAIDQLKVVGGKVDVEVFEMGKADPVKIAKEAYKYADKKSFDVMIIDTAGRLQIDEKLMKELREIKSAVSPTEIILTVDAMTGQEAVNVAKKFDEDLDLTGVVLSKLDGDTRGGAALSIKAITGKPIKFSSVGEKLTDLEPFYPDRMASRILGMGDVLTLIDKAQSAVSEEQMKKMEKYLRENKFTLQDYLDQLDSVKNMGDVSSMLGMLPGGNKIKASDVKIDEKQIDRTKAIILSMTKEEREKPEIISGSRRKRIAMGAGVPVYEVNKLLKQFDQMKQLMKMLKGNRGKMPKLP